MPELSRFYGIIVRMQNELGSKHHIPHVHVIYAGQDVVLSLTGEVLNGSIPSKQQKLVEAWMLIHEQELIDNWNRLNSGEQIIPIAPLK